MKSGHWRTIEVDFQVRDGSGFCDTLDFENARGRFHRRGSDRAHRHRWKRCVPEPNGIRLPPTAEPCRTSNGSPAEQATASAPTRQSGLPRDRLERLCTGPSALLAAPDNGELEITGDARLFRSFAQMLDEFYLTLNRGGTMSKRTALGKEQKR